MSRRLVFVGLETGTIDGIDSSARVVDLDACGFVPDGDEWADDVTIMGLAETSGVPFADLWAAYEWRRAFDRGVADANLSTGVTYGSPDSPLSVAYDMGRNCGERVAGDGWRWRADRGGWTHCDDRADYDDDGATCRKCYRFISHDDAAARMIE